MRHQVKTLTLALAFVAWGLPGALPAQPPELPAPTNLMVLGTSSHRDEAVTGQRLSVAQVESVASQSAQGGSAWGVVDAPTGADFDRNGDGQLTRDEVALVPADRGRYPMPTR